MSEPFFNGKQLRTEEIYTSLFAHFSGFGLQLDTERGMWMASSPDDTLELLLPETLQSGGSVEIILSQRVGFPALPADFDQKMDWLRRMRHQFYDLGFSDPVYDKVNRPNDTYYCFSYVLPVMSPDELWEIMRLLLQLRPIALPALQEQ